MGCEHFFLHFVKYVLRDFMFSHWYQYYGVMGCDEATTITTVWGLAVLLPNG
jgi:hypothetical protein